MLKCPFCHFENEDGALFCEQCKSDLGLAEPAVAGQAGPGTGGAAPEEGHAFTAVPEPITPLSADVLTEPRIVDTIPMAEIEAATHAHAADESQLTYPVADSMPLAAPVAEPPAESPPVAVPIVAPVEADAGRNSTGNTAEKDGAVIGAATAAGR